jgi:DNA-binding PadR family transcriptional regulator
VSVKFAVLGLLERGPSHGYDLKRAYDVHFGDVHPVKYGQIYGTLGRLERDGRVRFAGDRSGEGPDRKLYAITDDGVTDLEHWLAQPEAPEEQLRSVLFVKVVLALLSDRPAESFLEAQRALLLERMQHLTRVKSRGGVLDAAFADHRLFHLEADLRWIDATVARLARMREEVRQ